METKKDIYGRSWIMENARNVLSQYSGGITVRQLHYRLVALGMINDVQHYKRVVDAMGVARWDGVVRMDAFIDRERSMYGETEADDKVLENEIESAKSNIKAWMEYYNLERWSNQPEYIEVWIEKKALQGVFEGPCRRKRVGLAPCKGYPSITFLWDAYNRFSAAMAGGQEVTILYFGDYDPSGEDIPRAIEENLRRMGARVKVERRALSPEQISEMGLPGVPPKATDSRTNTWSGDEVVELDAVEPKILEDMVTEAIKEHFDDGKYEELLDLELKERRVYIQSLKEFVASLGGDSDDQDDDEDKEADE